MWKCDKCGRVFDNQNQNHFCKETVETIDDYIATQPIEIQPLLLQIRETISKTIPDAQEKIAWQMPTYRLKHNIIHFAGFKNHIGIYPGEAAMIYFAERFTDFKTSKGAIQLPLNKPLPLDLIAEIAKWCYENN